MKVTGYSPEVALNTINANVKAAGNASSYGSTGFTALGKSFGVMAEQMQKANDEADRQSILNAVDLFNKGRYNIMYNQDTGLMNTKADGSAGISNSYTEQTKKLRDEILGNTKIYSEANRVALDRLLANSYQQGFQIVDQHQYEQGEAVKDLRLENNVQNEIAFIQKNPLLINDSLQKISLLSAARYAGSTNSIELGEEYARKASSQLVSAAMSTLITEEDYDSAKALQDMYGDLLTPAQRENFHQVIYEKERNAYEYDIADQLYQQYNGNEAEIEAALDSMQGITVDNENIGLEDLIRAIGGQESNSNYNATNARTGAHGKYQIMPENWSPWAEEAGIGAYAEQTPENQEKVARYKLGQYYNKYGARGAAIAWYAGEGALSYSDNALNRKQGNGDEPSINEYANQVLERTGYAAININIDSKNRIMKIIRQKKSDADRREREQNDLFFDNITQQLFQMKSQGVSVEDATSWVEKQVGPNLSLLEKSRSAISTIYGGSGKGKKALGAAGKDTLEEMLKQGVFPDKASFLSFARSHGATDSEMSSLNTSYSNWLTGSSIYKYDFDNIVDGLIGDSIKNKQQKATMKAGIIAYGKNFVRKYRADHQGHDPSEYEVQEACQEAMTKKVYGVYTAKPGWLWDSVEEVEFSEADLARVGISSIKKVSDDMYEITYSDGRIGGNVNGGYIMSLINKE